MPELAPSLDRRTMALLAKPLSHFATSFTPVLAAALARTTFAFLYELARKTRADLEAWGFDTKAIDQTTVFLEDLDLALGLTLTPEDLQKVQEATYQHGAPRRQPRQPEPHSAREPSRS